MGWRRHRRRRPRSRSSAASARVSQPFSERSGRPARRGPGGPDPNPAKRRDVTDAIVVDDAHLLSTADLLALAEYVARPQATVVIAAEPHQHNSALRDLTRAIENEDAAVLLGPVPPAELSNYASTVGGRLTAPYDSELLRSLLATTAGVPFLVKSALRSGDPTEGRSSATTFSSAVRFALIQRLRGLDERLLDALLIGSLSPELGTADVAAALSLPSAEAHTLVDRARASGLIAPSLPPRFLLSVHGAVSQIVGATRHHELETQLLTTQLGLETLTTDLALRLAEHGTRDDRLARVLERQARSASGEPGRVARLYRAAVNAGAGGSGGGLDTPARGRARADGGLHHRRGDRRRPARVRGSGSAAAAVRIAAARLALSAENAGPPTSTASAARSLAEGLMLTLDQPFAHRGDRAAGPVDDHRSQPGRRPGHRGRARHARRDARRRPGPRAQRHRAGGARQSGRRRRPLPLLSPSTGTGCCWAGRMQDGQLSAAASDAVAIDSAPGAELHRRDALWASALQTGIARRAGTPGRCRSTGTP